jgi:arginyl-tRNA--protein-N-Asp/Glu arginylyltransferase
MFAQVHIPTRLLPEELDRYLSQGWFRMGQTIFTTNFLNFKRQLFSAVWLRIDLERFLTDKVQQKLFRMNDKFRSEFRPFVPDVAKDRLYAAYRDVISFEASSSLEQLLFRDAPFNVFDTWEVNLYDGEQLIATGLFDLGARSAEGIVSFYDPAYKKFSLGKYLIYLKIQYCRKLGLRFFYPGYFVPGYYSFDYKLAIGRPALEFFDVSSHGWHPIDEFKLPDAPLNVMHEKLRLLAEKFDPTFAGTKLLKYEFFDVNLVPDLTGAALFDFPLFVSSEIAEPAIMLVIVYDVRDQMYHLIKSRVILNPGGEDHASEGFYSNLLMVEKHVYETRSAEQMFDFASKELQLKASIRY